MAEDSRFPPTRPSLLAATHGVDDLQRERAWDALARMYWKPVYKYLRLRWHAGVEEAQDWTQEFFARALEKGFLAGFDPARARFRTFLRVCLDGFAQEARRAQGRLKRGGAVRTLSLDFTGAEDELAGIDPPAPERLDDYFHQEWMRSLFEVAVEDLTRTCQEGGKLRQLEVFRRYDLEAPERREKLTYADLARELDVPVTQITNWLFAMRARLRELLLARLRELCSGDDEFRAEARALLGVVPR